MRIQKAACLFCSLLLIAACVTVTVKNLPAKTEQAVFKVSNPDFPQSFGPYILIPSGNFSNAVVSFYTVKETSNRIRLSSGTSNIILSDSAPSKWHRFSYQPIGHNFSYRIESEDEALDRKGGNVSLPWNESFRFAAYGDSRDAPEGHPLVAEAVASYRPQFVVHTGDLVSDGNNKSLWPAFFNEAASYLSQTPIFPVPGNHDRHSSAWESIFPMAAPTPYRYSVDLPGTRMIFLDSESDLGTNSEQYRWFTNTISSASNFWKIVTLHRTPYSSTYHSADPELKIIQNELFPALEKYHVNLVLAGHDHLYERYHKDRVVCLTLGGGGAPFYPVTQTNVYKVKTVTNELSFAVIDVSEREIEVRVYNEKKRLLDRFEIIE